VEIESRTARGEAAADPLAARLADGDPSAPREVVERHRAELLRYATALLRDAASAEDAVQEAFSRAFEALGRYPEGRIRLLSLRAWLYRITLNVVRNSWRVQRREVPVARVPEGPGGVPSAAPDGPEARLDALEALVRLPERQRTAVALRYLSDLPYAEIALATGWPEATCKTLVRRGLGRLQLLMSVTEGEGGGT
jgi:RNA polymerase sigma-70 factor (ECF subfamily)